jgi:hypothetical protein
LRKGRIKVVRELPTGKQSAEESRDLPKQSFKTFYRLTTVQKSDPLHLSKHNQIMIPDCMRSTGTCGKFHVIPKGPVWKSGVGTVYPFDMAFEATGPKTDPSFGYCKLSLAE